MSIKRKLATSLATAGLLAGIFGSALAPVAHASVVKGNVLRDELRYNLSGGYDDLYHSGTASDPYVMYAPLTNDGTSTDPIGWSDNPICFQADETYFETTGGVDLHDDGDEIPVKVTATNGLGIFFYDSNDYSSGVYESSESAWTTGSKTIDDIYDGISLCLAPLDDDDAYTSTVTITVRGQVAWTFTVVVVGPATSLTPVNYIGSWVAESNGYIEDAAVVAFKDKAGQSLSAYGISFSDRVDYAKTGYTSNPGANVLMVFVDDMSIGDSESDMVTTDGPYIDLEAGFCGEMGDKHTLMAAVNVDTSADGNGNGTLTAADLKSGTWSYNCSADGSEALWTGFAFDATSVAQGESVTAHFSADDGYGHPMGIGSTYGQYLHCDEVSDGYAYIHDEDAHCAMLLPVEFVQDSTTNEGNQHLLGAQYGWDEADDGACGYDDWENPISDSDRDNAYHLINGNVGVCYLASLLNTGVAAVVFRAYDLTTGGGDPVTLRAAISVTSFAQQSDVANTFGKTIKIGKRTVSITGPVGAKVMFIVEDAKMNVSTYYRVVGADGKAALRFRKKGFFKVTAVLGDLISNTGYIVPKY